VCAGELTLLSLILLLETYYYNFSLFCLSSKHPGGGLKYFFAHYYTVDGFRHCTKQGMTATASNN